MIFEPIPTTEKRRSQKAAPTLDEVTPAEKMPGTDSKDNRSVADDVAALRPANRYDVHIWGVYIMLCIISIVELYSASSREITGGNIYAPLLRHVMHLVIGFVIILALQRVHYRKFFDATPWIVFGSLLAMIYTLINGDYINGAKRSFSIVIMRVQPAEFLKFSAVLLVAYVLCKSSRPDRRKIESWRVCLCAGVVGTFGALLFFQGLTNTLLLMAISLSMMFVASVSWRNMAIILCVYAVLGGAGYAYKKLTLKHADKPNVEQVGPNGIAMTVEDVPQKRTVNRAGVWESRMSNFLRFDKYKDTIRDYNAQEQYSYIAQAHGGIYGVGPGNSRETSRLSLAFSDYIYAIVVEEGGLLLGLFVMILYMWLVTRASTLAYKCNLVYPALLMLGLSVFIVVQALFHMAIVTGACPVSGQPLPLISKGGTSILVSSVAFGIMLSVSRHALQEDNRQQIKADISSLPEDLRQINPSHSR